MFIDPLNLKQEQILSKDQEFLELLGRPAEAELAYKELNLFFKQLPVANRAEYYYSYWRWYTQLTWVALGRILAADVPMVIADQMSVALRMDMPVGHTLLRYIETMDGTELEAVYVKMRDAAGRVELSTAPNENKKFEEAFFPVNKTEAQNRLRKIKSFFKCVPAADISKVMLAYTVGTAVQPLGSIDEKKTPPDKIAPTPIQLKATLAILYTDVADSHKIAEFLQKVSEFYKQDTFMELYYYDQSDNQFHWNDEVLKS